VLYDEFVIKSSEPGREIRDGIEVEMPVGLFVEYAVSPPCGICSLEKTRGTR